MVIDLFRYYLTGRHFTVVTDHASLTWLHNIREPEGMVARWIVQLQPFDKGRRKADLETPYGPAPELEENLWATWPFAEATWRPTYRVIAINSADDVDPRVQEVLDLPVLNLAVAQDEDPRPCVHERASARSRCSTPVGYNSRKIRRSEDPVGSISLDKIPRKCPISLEKRNRSQPPMASSGPQASQIPDLQGLPSSRHGCSSRGSEDCCLDKETFLLAESAKGH